MRWISTRLLIVGWLTCLIPRAVSHARRSDGRETVEEAAANTKRLLQQHPTGVISTVFQGASPNAGRPYAIMEYAAPCDDDGSLTFLLFPESVTTQNILHSSAGETTYTVSEPFDGARSAVAQARVALMGVSTSQSSHKHEEEVTADCKKSREQLLISPNTTILHDVPNKEYDRLASCYRKYHPDAFWLPGRTAGHPFDSMWARFEPVDIYYVGGFGDTHYIGHIPLDVYRAASVKEDEASFVIQGDF